MGVIQRVVKPKTHRGKRELVKREPKLIENTKQCIFMRGAKCSDTAITFMKDLCKVKKPNSVYFSRKNELRPFEAVNEIEGMCKKYDSSLFAFGSHNKKRPHNLVIGRTFDTHVLDMVEIGIQNFKGLNDFKNQKITTGCKPCLIFMGDPFQSPSSEYYRIKNLLVDFFHGEEVTNIRLEGIEHVISFLALENKIVMKSYRIILKKSGEKVPFVELDEIGPSAELIIRRTKLASDDLFKTSCRQPRELKVKKVKNITKDPFGSKLGRIHMPKQNLNSLPTRNMKGLKKTVAEKKLQRAEKTKKADDLEANNPTGNGTRLSRRMSQRKRNAGLSGANLIPVSKPIGAVASSAASPSPSLSKLSTLNTSNPNLMNFSSSIKIVK